MDEEKQEMVAEVSTPRQQNTPKAKSIILFFALTTIVAIILISAGYFLYANNLDKKDLENSIDSTPEQESVQDDTEELGEEDVEIPEDLASGRGKVGIITSQSNGVLSLRNKPEVYAGRLTLFFNNFQTKTEESIALNALQDVDPFLSGGKLYYLVKKNSMNSVIVSIDIFTGQSETLPLGYEKDTPVHSFFIRGSNLYFLVGKHCTGYFENCDRVRLQNYNLTTGIIETLADGIEARNIGGFDSTGDNILLYRGGGIGGCDWREFWLFTFSSETISRLGSNSFCEERDEEDPFAQFEDLVADSGSFGYGYLIVRNGKILTPRSNDEYPTGERIRVNADEYPLE